MSVSLQIDRKLSKPLYIQLYEAIKQKILNGDYTYMQKLPSVRTLCNSLKVNLSTVNKALNLLQSEGYIKSVPGSGYYVVYNEYQEKPSFEEELIFSSNDGYINLASSKLPYSMYPVDEFKTSINKTIDKYGPAIFDYVETFSNPLKEFLVKDYLEKFKIKAQKSNLTIVSGAQQGIEITAKSFLKPGDVILMENPSYLGAYNIFDNLHLNVVGIDVLEMDNLEFFVKKYNPKAVYVIPYSQNPTGISYSEEFKSQICELAQKYDFYIIEDDFLSDVGILKGFFPIKSYDKFDRVFYIKSFSLLTMPALRIGFVVPPSDFSDDVAYYKSIADISTSLFIQGSFSYFLKNYFDSYIKALFEFIEKRQKTFKWLIHQSGLKDRIFLPDIKGIFTILLLPHNISSAVVYNRLKAEKVLVLPHSCFYHKPNSINFLRVCFLNCTDEQMLTGIEKIRIALDSLLKN